MCYRCYLYSFLIVCVIYSFLLFLYSCYLRYFLFLLFTAVISSFLYVAFYVICSLSYTCSIMYTCPLSYTYQNKRFKALLYICGTLHLKCIIVSKMYVYYSLNVVYICSYRCAIIKIVVHI